MLYNFHMHSNFSDGACEPEEYVKSALELGFKAIGFSEHSVLPFSNTFALQSGREDEYVNEISRLKAVYAGKISLYTSMEVDYIPGLSTGFKALKDKTGLDYIIGSVHLVKGPPEAENLWFIDGPKVETYDDGIRDVFGGDIKKAVTAYWHQVFDMIEEEEFDVVGHLDKIKMHNKGRWFDEKSDWYTSLTDHAIELIARRDLLVEVNTRGIYKKRSAELFPGTDILKKLHSKDVRIVLSSDAHHPSEINAYFNEAILTLKECGYTSAWVFDSSSWAEVAFRLPS